MPVNLNQYRGTVGTFNSRYLIRFRNSYQHVKCHLNDIDIPFSVISFSCSILTPINILFIIKSWDFRMSYYQNISVFKI